MIDQTINRREAILDRIFQLGQGINEVATTLRNPNPLPTEGILGVQRPVFILFDGGTNLAQDVLPHKIRQMPTTIWKMKPQIVLLLEQRDNFENIMLKGHESPIGPELSRWSDLIDNIVTNDPVLIDIVTENGTHVLTAIETDLKVGRSVGAYGAWLMMLYDFYYPRFPARS